MTGFRHSGFVVIAIHSIVKPDKILVEPEIGALVLKMNNTQKYK